MQEYTCMYLSYLTLYQGSPSESHSLGTVRVVSPSGRLPARDLLAFARVQNQAAKSSILAFSPSGNTS